MYLIYVDDYGNSGKKLDDPKQPLFMLFSTMIPLEHWADIEKELLEVTHEICTRCGIQQTKFKLHAWEFFSNYKYKELSFDERAGYALRIAQIADKYDASYLLSYVKKHELIEMSSAYSALEKAIAPMLDIFSTINPEQKKIAENIFPELGKILFDPYALALTDLVRRHETWLSGKESKGMIIIDRQQEYESMHSFRTLSAMRSTGEVSHLIEQPLQGIGSVNVMLQITDVLGYIVGGFLKMQFYGKNFPDRHNPTATLVRKRLEMHDATASFSRKNKPGHAMFTEILFGRLGIDFEQKRLIEELQKPEQHEQSVEKQNTEHTIQLFLKRKGEKRSSEPEPQDG